jgi:hypothetical protein
MWIMLNDAFFSIVDKDCARSELLVRARRRGDIEKLFPRAKVSYSTKGDYLARARVTRVEIIQMLESEVRHITYDNFKSSVEDNELHNAYLGVWTEMAKIQPTPPYSGSRKRGKR